MDKQAVIEPITRALAGAMPLLGLVLVSADRPPRVLWHDGRPDPDKLDGLLVLGRDLLNAAPTEASSAAASTAAVTGLTIRDPDGVGRGVLFGMLHDGEPWVDARRAQLELAASAATEDLLKLIDRPRPAPIGAGPCPELECQLRTAVERNEFVLLYQPEIDIRTGRIVALEALLRWDHPGRGRLAPDAFIGVAEQSDVIKLVGHWVIENAIREFARWDNDRVVLRINVSPAQLSGEGIVGQLESALRAYGVPAGQVGIEFTETASSGDITELVATLRALTERGIGSAIDDLATGYSTLSRLRLLPVDTVKIDRSLVVDIDRDARARAIVRAVVAMGRELGLEVVGEGIETADEALTLAGLGCHRGQGHYFGLPRDAIATEALLRASPARADPPPDSAA